MPTINIWAKDDVILPVAGTQNKILPDPLLLSRGWDLGQKVAAEELNFILNEITTTLNKASKYGAPLIGELVFWPKQQMPQDIFTDCGMVFIPYIGQSFDTTLYPELAKIHPTGVLPVDMRGEFPRGWDNGRGVDAGRALLNAQGDAIREITGEWSSGAWEDAFIQAGAIQGGSSGTSSYHQNVGPMVGRISGLNFRASRVVPTANENRPRNISWHLIVRAS